MAEATDRPAWIGGNIGRPLISELDQMDDEDVVVQELSSFQLELWTCSPQIAAILNITPNHLDRHGTMAAYSAAKSNILRFQASDDVAVLSADDPGASVMREVVQGRLRQFSLHLEVEDGAFIRRGKVWLVDGEKEWAVCDLESIPLRGWHNVLNVLASTVLAHSVGVSTEAMTQAIVSFSGVEHRLELVRTIDGVQYVNDSIATAPERAIAAVDSFQEPLILLAGGRDKDMIWETWAQKILERVKAVVLFGELAEQLSEMLLDSRIYSGKRPVIVTKKTMEEALEVASNLAEPGDVVLLAPGGTSFDAYVDFAERGVVFRQLVHTMADKKRSNS
jgi:UDP-N-acetylmuramoylalanine--D-glutamate ligase